MRSLQSTKPVSIIIVDRIPCWCFSSGAAQGGGGSFKNRKPTGSVGLLICMGGRASRWWIDKWLEFHPVEIFGVHAGCWTYGLDSPDAPMHAAITGCRPTGCRQHALLLFSLFCLTARSDLSICLSAFLSVCLSIDRSIDLSIYLSLSIIIYLHLSIFNYRSI